MKRFFLICLVLYGFSSCDDGDIIITSFDFEDIELRYCGSQGDYVFFKINNINLETLSLRLKTQDTILTREHTYSYSIDSINNVVNYRTFNSEIPVTYFCNSIPPVTPSVVKNYRSSQGFVTVSTVISEIKVNPLQPGDTTFTYISTFTIENVRLVSSDETITQETLNLGSITTIDN